MLVQAWLSQCSLRQPACHHAWKLDNAAHLHPSRASAPPRLFAGAVTCDAHHMTDPHPEGLGVSTCIELALKDARIERDEVWAPTRRVARRSYSACVGASAGTVTPRALPLPPPLPQVNYINAHATSTLVGDKAEVKAIKKVRQAAVRLSADALGICCVSACCVPLPAIWPSACLLSRRSSPTCRTSR